MSVNKIWKIRNKEGLFSTGGMSPYFNKEGKIWKTKAHIDNHIQLFYKKRGEEAKRIYANCEVVIYELVFLYKKSITSFTEDVLKEVEEKK